MTAPTSPEPGEPTDGQRVYDVTIRGTLGRGLRDAFGPMVATSAGGVTTLHGPVEDQAAMDGLLHKIWGYGLELEEIRRSPGRQPPSSTGSEPAT